MTKKKSAPTTPVLLPADRERAARCKRLRVALGYAQSAGFAAFLEVSPQRWNFVENGRPLGHELAMLLVSRISGLSLDWLYLGRPDGLSLALARKLGEAPPAGS